MADLDDFLRRCHAYHSERGLACALLSRALNLLTLAFTVFFSAFLLTMVNWERLGDCDAKDECDIIKEAIRERPAWGLWSATYTAVFLLYLLSSTLGLVRELPVLLSMRAFYRDALRLPDAALGAATWAEVLQRLARIQDTRRICLAKELTPLDMMQRITRRDNYVVGMVDAGLLPLHVGLPQLGVARRPMLTAYVLELLHWFVLDHFLDAANCRVRAAAVALGAEASLRRRLRRARLICLVLSPFFIIFGFVFFFIRHAEYLYRHPAAIGERDWTGYARFRLRALNEVPRAQEKRLARAHEHAERYVAMFPSPIVGMIAKFVAFVIGAFAAILLFVAAMDEELLRAEVGDRQLLWYAALFTVILAVCRALSPDVPLEFDPRETLQEAMRHLRFSPRAWQCTPASPEAQVAMAELFKPRVLSFAEEMLSVLVGPLMLMGPIADRSKEIVAFFRDNSVDVNGVGDVFCDADFTTALSRARPTFGFGPTGGGDSGNRGGGYSDGSWAGVREGANGTDARVSKVEASMRLFADAYGREGWAEPGSDAAALLDGAGRRDVEPSGSGYMDGGDPNAASGRFDRDADCGGGGAGGIGIGTSSGGFTGGDDAFPADPVLPPDQAAPSSSRPVTAVTDSARTGPAVPQAVASAMGGAWAAALAAPQSAAVAPMPELL